MVLEANVLAVGFCQITLESDRIARVERLGPKQAGAVCCSPGLVDIQINGFAGVDFSSPDLEPDAVISLLPALGRTGVTSFCPTLITNSREALARNFEVLETARRTSALFDRSAPCYHLEGPYISGGASRGAHNPAFVRPPDWGEFCELQQAAGGRIGIVTLAPELPGAIDFIRRLKENGVAAAISHTDGAPADVHSAADAGAELSTHLGNGCPALIDRHQAPFWAQLSDSRLHASLICDTIHTTPEMVKVIYGVKGPAKCILISDAVHAAGLPAGRYSLVGTEIDLLAEGKVVRADGGSLAGSALSMNLAVTVFSRFAGVSLTRALRAATTNPARLLKHPRVCERIAPGQPANLILFTPGLDRLEIREVFLAGTRVFSPSGGSL
jgi:N-acetylglucosamine-6-phosphate deacetylase